MKFFIFLLLCMVASVSCGEGQSAVYVARVRQLPSILFKCNAFFVTKDFLIGTAACFLCSRQCNFQVVVGLSDVGVEENEVYDVTEVNMHPKYTSGVGNMYNIAVIKLKTPATNPIVLRLAREPSYEWGEMPMWSFSADLKRYRLEYIPFRRIPKNICKDANKMVRVDEYCSSSFGNQSVISGILNEGVPHVLGAVTGKQLTVLGFHGRVGNEVPNVFYSFTSIPRYYPWIMNIISRN